MTKAWPKIIMHADMDAFYAAVEQLDHPELRGKPVLIGPNSHRGVVLAASYEARPYGVGSAMPMGEARRRCPQAICVPPNLERYQEVSSKVMDVFADFSPYVEAISLDEAFLDMSGAEHIFGPPDEMAKKLKAAVYDATQLDISVGVSATKYVAKVASAHDKPNGLTIVPHEDAVAWLAPLPINRLWGVGKKNTPKLEQYGYRFIADIQNAELPVIERQLGWLGRHVYSLANAEDPRRVTRGRAAKSIGSDRTLSQDVSKTEDILIHLRRSSERIARRIRAKQYSARGVRIRLKTSCFQLLTRQRMFSKPVDTADALFGVARQLVNELNHAGPFRLVGMAAFDLSWRSDPLQLDIFEDASSRELEITIDELIERFGSDVIMRGQDLQNHGEVSRKGVNLDFLDQRDGERLSYPR